MSRPVKTLTQASGLLEHYAELAAAVDHIEAQRAQQIAAANGAADAELAPLIAELEQLRARLQPWWAEAGPGLAGGKKSVQLGGCMIGVRKGRPKLAHNFASDDQAVEALMLTRHVKLTTKVRYSLDRTATLKLIELGGKAGKDVAALGFRIEQGEAFFVERAAQDATIAP